MKMYFKNGQKCGTYHLCHKLKYGVLEVVLFLFVIFSIYFLLLKKDIDHDKGAVSSELTQMEEKKDNSTTKISYVDEMGRITYAVDKQYATLVQTKDINGRILKEFYLDEDGEPTVCQGHFGISYEYKKDVQIIRYLDKEGNSMKTESGYTILVRSFDKQGLPVDDMYYDENMNPVMCVGGNYGLHREHSKKGLTRKIVYLNIDGLPICIKGGFAQESRLFDEEGRIAQKFFFDVDGNPICLQLGQAGEAYTYDEYNRVTQITYLNQYGKPIVTTAGYTILKKSYYHDGTEKSNMYYDISGNPIALAKGQYGIKYVGSVLLYLNQNGKVILCIDNILNEYPCMVVVVGILMCIFLCLLPEKFQRLMLLAYIIFIFYETLMFRETGDTRANLILFSYASTFMTDRKIRVDVINNIWLFVPLGTGFYTIFRKKMIWIVALILSVIIELSQYFTGWGIAELDDLFGNTFGGVIGVGIGMVILHQIDRYRNISNNGRISYDKRLRI